MKAVRMLDLTQRHNIVISRTKISTPERKNKRVTRGRVLCAGCAVMLSFVGVDASAHNPHDPALAFAASPDLVNDQTLYVATFPELNWSYKDILRSTDGGVSWTKLPNGMDNRFDFSAIRVSPSFSDDYTVYASTRGDGVYQSSDRGNSWRTFNAGLRGLNVTDIEIGGSKHTDYMLYAALSTGGIYRRASTQTAWTLALSTSIKVNAMATSPDFTQDSTVVTADTTGRLRISTTSGTTWTDLGIAAAATVNDIAIAPGGAKEIFLATSRNGVFYSNDSGKTFTNKITGLPAETISNIAVSPNYLVDHTVFCTSRTLSVFKSTDSGSSWTLYPSGAAITGQASVGKEFIDLQISNNYATDGTVFLAAFDGLFRSTTAGDTWSQLQTRTYLTTGLALSTGFMTDHHVIASNYASGGLYASADGGATWTRAVNGWNYPKTSPHSFFDVDFVSNHVGPPMAVAVQNYSAIGFTSDFGASWDMKRIPDMPDVTAGRVYPTVIGLSSAFDTDQVIYLGTRKHGIIQSLDGAQTWRAKRGVPTNVLITSLVVSPNYANDHTAFSATLGGQVWRTINGGDNWSRVGSTSILTRAGNNFNKFTWVAMSPNFAIDHLVLVGTNKGVYRSLNGGDTWTPIGASEIGPLTVIRQIEFSPNFAEDQTVFVTVRGRGMYRVLLDPAANVASLQNIGMPLLAANAEFTEFRVSPNFKVDATLLGASEGAVYRSTDAGLTWTIAGYTGGG